MDWTKYPFEKLLHFIAAVIPGLVVLLIVELTVPGSIRLFFGLGFLGYRTKIGVILAAAFVIGYSLTSFLNMVLLVVGGAIGAVVGARRYKPPHSNDSAPWRDPRWRSLVKIHLGARSPDDTLLVPRINFDMNRKFQEILPEQARTVPLTQLDAERLKLEMDDDNWAAWYDQYHALVIQKQDVSFDSYVHRGLAFNFETAALCVLLSAAFTSSLRHWWYILPACLWAAYFVLETVGTVHRQTNKWLSLSEQIRYLSEEVTEVRSRPLPG